MGDGHSLAMRGDDDVDSKNGIEGHEGAAEGRNGIQGRNQYGQVPPKSNGGPLGCSFLSQLNQRAVSAVVELNVVFDDVVVALSMPGVVIEREEDGHSYRGTRHMG